MTDPRTIDTVPELLAHAHAMEAEAHDRYVEFAEQLEVHNNIEVAELFRKMAYVEQMHAKKILERAGDIELPHISPWEYSWSDLEGPETIDVTDIHYLMTPYQAISLALKAEQRALAFYSDIVENQDDADLLDLAKTLQQEEQEHVELMTVWLKKYPKPEEDWDEDPDPPVMNE